jgi:hypothetical protein
VLAAFCVTCVVLLAAQAAWVIIHHRPGSGITYKNFEKIQIGMTLEKVTQILGDPPGIHITMPFTTDSNPGRSIKYPPDEEDGVRFMPEIFISPNCSVRPANCKTWANDQACIDVYFDENGAVITPCWATSSYGFELALRPSLWTRLRLVLGF